MPEEKEDRKRGRRRAKGEPGFYYLPPKPEGELPREEDGKAPEYGWSDVLAFVVAAYQVIFPILGIMFGVFLLIWGVLWLLAR